MSKQELIRDIIRLYSELDKKETELSDICEKEIQPLVDAKKYQEAKAYVHSFYKELVDKNGNSLSIEKDIIQTKLNHLIYNQNETE